MRAGKEDFLIADYLDIYIYSPSVEITDKFTRKSSAKEFFTEINMPVSPGRGNINTKEDFIDTLTLLIS